MTELPVLTVSSFKASPGRVVDFNGYLAPVVSLVAGQCRRRLFALFAAGLAFSRVGRGCRRHVTSQLVRVIIPVEFNGNSCQD